MTEIKPHRHLKRLLFVAGLGALTVTPLIVHTLAYNWDVATSQHAALADTAHDQPRNVAQFISSSRLPARPTSLPLPPQPRPEPPVPPTPTGAPPHFG